METPTPSFSCIILAAGKGTRMVSKMPKITHMVMGTPMIRHVVAAARALNPKKLVVVIGHERQVVEECLKNDNVILKVQEQQLGTAHAVLAGADCIDGEDVLILCGDVPLIKSETLAAFIQAFKRSEGIVFMTTDVENPAGYGRIIIGDDNEIIDIVEDNDASDETKKIRTINTGICMIRTDMLALVREIEPNEKKGEYYLTDICKTAKNRNVKVKAFFYPHAKEVLGINTRKELMDANLIMRNEIIDRHMAIGVTICDRTVYIEKDVVIEKDTIIHPYCHISGRTTIGEDAVIGPYAYLKDCTIAPATVVHPFSFLSNVTTNVGDSINLASEKITLRQGGLPCAE
jgi:bifunctional UDP-N-acetylglucosamine pyrophosphorylase / glucosamine-1-phosphate N-acetyltransferase